MSQKRSIFYKIIVLVAIAALTASCSTYKYRMYQGAVEESPHHLFSRVPGSNAIYEVYYFIHNPILPMAWEGYALFIEPDPELILEGNAITLPNPKVIIHLYRSLHYGWPAEKDLNGEIKIVEVKQNYVVIKLNVASAHSKWELNETAKFKAIAVGDIKD